MIWRRKDPDDDRFVTFDDHQDTRIAALEADLLALTKGLLSYMESDTACAWMGAAKELTDTLRTVIEKREAKK